MKISTLCLTSCTGCHVSLLHQHERMAELLSSGQLVFSPLLMDVKEPQECDVAIVEGCIRNEEDVDKLATLRQRAKILICLGTCAVYGGIAGLGNVCSSAELIEEAYFTNDTQPSLTPRVIPIDSIVAVDWYIPGCPPPPDVLAMFLDGLLKGKRPQSNDLPVCAECPRVVRGEFSTEVKRTYESDIDPQECLLQQGFICLGSVTRAGCGAPCTAAGMPCIGCRGPTHRLLVEASHGIFEDWIQRRCHYLKVSEKEAERHLRNIKHTLYAFTLSSPFMRGKRTERVAELVYRINRDRVEV